MAIDFTQQSVGSGYQDIDVLNENFEALEDAAQDALSRSGRTPNHMLANLDMNSNRIINLPAPQSDHDAARYVDVLGGITTTEAVLPTQAGNTERFLSTDGSNWVFKDIMDDEELYTHSGTGGTARTLQSKLEEWTSVADFGAVGDGVTDDTAEIQAALDWAEANSPCILYFPAGTYLVSSTLTLSGDNISLVGAGPYQTEILGNFADGDILHLDGPNSGGNCIGLRIADFRVDSSVTKTSGAGIHAEFVARSTFERIILGGQDGNRTLYHGIWFDDFDFVRLCDFETWVLRDGVLISTTGNGGDIFIMDGKIGGSQTEPDGVGMRFAGLNGGVICTRCSMNNCGTAAAIIDQSIEAQGNRQVSFLECAFDGESILGVRQQPGLIINDSGCQDVFINNCFFSVNTYGIDIQACSVTTTRIHINGGRNAQCDDDCILLQDEPHALIIGGGHEIHNAAGYGINSTVDQSGRGYGEGVFIGNDTVFRDNALGDVNLSTIPVNPGAHFAHTLDDDAAFSFKLRDFTTVGSSGYITVTAGITTTRANVYVRATSSGVAVVDVGTTSGFTLTTGALTGTTGSDGNQTISAHTDERIYIENRSGSAITYIIHAYGGGWPHMVTSPV